MLLVTHGDPDLWGHVRYGLDFLETWSLPSIDPYSFTQDRPWVNHEWLSEAFMAAAYQLSGNAGLIALKVLVLGTGMVVVARCLPSRPLLVREGLLVLLTWASLPLTITMRPQIWTFLLLPLVLVALRRPRRLSVVPLILASWANLHGGWLVGLGVVWMWAVGEAIEGRRGELRVALVSTLATLVTPYGWGLWRFLGETVRLGRSDITEWQPFATLPTYHFVPFVVLVLLGGLEATSPVRKLDHPGGTDRGNMASRATWTAVGDLRRAAVGARSSGGTSRCSSGGAQPRSSHSGRDRTARGVCGGHCRAGPRCRLPSVWRRMGGRSPNHAGAEGSHGSAG